MGFYIWIFTAPHLGQQPAMYRRQLGVATVAKMETEHDSAELVSGGCHDGRRPPGQGINSVDQELGCAIGHRHLPQTPRSPRS